MVTATHNIESEEAGLNERLKHLKLHTHFDASGQEPLSFLASVAETTGRAEETPSGAPTAQDIECLRQAAWKYTRQTAEPVATALDLSPVLHRLGYV